MTSTFPRWKGDNEPPFVFRICQELKSNFQIIVLAPHARGTKTEENLEGIIVRRFRYFPERWETLAYEGGIMSNLKRRWAKYLLVPFFLVAQLYAMRRIIKLEKIDIIHAHWLIPQGLTAAICKAFSHNRALPLLCTSHGSDLLSLKGPVFSAINKQVIKKTDALSVVSNAMTVPALQLGASKKKVFVMPMGIDIDKFRPDSSLRLASKIELLFVGRLVKSKSVDTLLRAMPAIVTQFPGASLTIVGDGPEKIKLETLAKSLKVSCHVHFCGAKLHTELPTFYQSASIFISPTLSEGFGLTLAEALACECAVIASDLPAIREIILDGETGFLVPPGDVQALYQRVLTLAGNHALRSSLGKSGRKMVCERFSWTSVGIGYTNLLNQLCLSPTRM